MIKSKYDFKSSRKSIDNYFKWRIERARPLIKKVELIKKLRKGTTALDIGCGYGALSQTLINKGVTVFATEVDIDKIKVARKTVKSPRFKLTKVNNEKLPYKDEFFDFIFLFDVVEHVGNPQMIINEAIRVLKKNGVLYVEFTPYFSLAGHHLYDYTRFPIHLYKDEKYIQKLIFSNKPNTIFTSKYYLDLYKSLNKLKIDDFKKFVSNMKVENEYYIIKYPNIFEVNLQFLKFIPSPLKDLFCFSFEGLYVKK